MSKKMLIDAGHPEETRVALITNGKVEDFDFESQSRKPLRGNIYLARVTRVEPSLQAAFVEYGGNRHGFLAFSEIHPDYYQVPIADRDILKKAEKLEAELAAQMQTEEAEEEQKPKKRRSRKSSRKKADEAEASDSETLEAEEQEPNTASDEDDDDNGDDDSDIVAKTAEDVETFDDSDVEDLDDEEQSSRAALMAEASAEESVDIDTSDLDEDSSDEAEAADEASEEEAGEDGEEKPKRRKKEKSLEERYRDARRERIKLMRNYKIQEVIKRRQILLIQVVKEERGNKGAALTTYLSLAGRYCVLMPNTARGGGISRKITNASDRKRLRSAVSELEIPEGIGLIIRTAGSARTKTEIKRDYEYLLRLWTTIRDLTMKSIAPCLIYEEASLIKRAIRDLYDKDISEVVVEGEEGYREAKDFMKMLMPSHAKNVQPYKERVPLFLSRNVEKQLDEMYQPEVKLKSGGYLVIQQTEALISIDVNSGRSTKERNIEATALKTNLEAAAEVARQCRLRDLAGLVIIDFIDMEENRNNRAVEKKLKEAVRVDRARIQMSRISNFGLLEMSRQRRRSGIVDGTTHTCPTCQGAGAVRSHEMASLRILRSVEEEALSGKVGIVTVRTSIDVAMYILNSKRDWIMRIEETYGILVEVIADPNKAGDHYDIESRGTPRETAVQAAVVRPDLVVDETETAGEASSDSSDDGSDEQPKKRRRRRRRGRKPEHLETSETADQDTQDGDEETSQDAETSSDSEEPKRRRRGRRGGRRNRRRTEGDAQESAETGDKSDQPSGKSSTESPSGESAEKISDEAETSSPEAENTDVAAEKPKRKPRKKAVRKSTKKTAETAEDVTPKEEASEASSETATEEEAVKEKPAKKKRAPRKKAVKKAAPKEDTKKEVKAAAPKAEAAEEPVAEAESPKKKRKAGWWQRALKG